MGNIHILYGVDTIILTSCDWGENVVTTLELYPAIIIDMNKDFQRYYLFTSDQLNLSL